VASTFGPKNFIAVKMNTKWCKDYRSAVNPPPDKTDLGLFFFKSNDRFVGGKIFQNLRVSSAPAVTIVVLSGEQAE